MGENKPSEPSGLPMPGVNVTQEDQIQSKDQAATGPSVITRGRPTTPTTEAQRLQEQWDQESPELDGDELRERALQTIHSLVTLVAAGEHMAGEWDRNRHRDYHFDGEDHCPSFFITTHGSDVEIVIDHKPWLFDGGDTMNEEMWGEVTSPLQQFIYTKLDSRVIYSMASMLLAKFGGLVREGRITKKGE